MYSSASSRRWGALEFFAEFSGIWWGFRDFGGFEGFGGFRDFGEFGGFGDFGGFGGF